MLVLCFFLYTKCVANMFGSVVVVVANGPHDQSFAYHQESTYKLLLYVFSQVDLPIDGHVLMSYRVL